MGRDAPTGGRPLRLPVLAETPLASAGAAPPTVRRANGALAGSPHASPDAAWIASPLTAGGTPAAAVLPPALHAALDEPLESMALEDWLRTHHEAPRQHTDCESQLLSCEAELKKLDHLCSRLRPPNMVVTAVVVDLLRRVFATMPPRLAGLCAHLLRFVEGAVYSEEPLSGADQQHMEDALGARVDRLPYLVVVKRQQETLGRLQARAEKLQQEVGLHMERRRHVMEFDARLHREERQVLQMWLFKFWVMTFRNRQFRVHRMATVALVSQPDIVTPYMSWRLFVCQQRLEKSRAEYLATDKEASRVANRITEVEIENEEHHTKLQASLDESARLQVRCQEEQLEHARLQQLWDATQPELLLRVLAQSLEFLFMLVTRTASFSLLILQHRLVGKDVLPLLENLPPLEDTPTEVLLVRWLNGAIARARASAKELLDSPDLPAASRAQVEAVVHQPEVSDLGEGLADSGALCALLAVLQAKINGRPVSAADLAPLSERDPDLRAELLWASLQHLAPTARARCLLTPLDIVTGNAALLGEFVACLFLQEPLLPDLGDDVGPSERGRRQEMLRQVIRRIGEHAGRAASEPPDDPTPLLLRGEDFEALAAASTEQLLLRWVNVQLQSVFHRPVENFGSDLQDGEAIGLLLTAIAPEALVEDFSTDHEERLEQIVDAAARCTDFELLTVAAIIEGQSDMLAAFFAQLFLSRSNLAAKPDSLLAMHLKLLEDICSEGLDAVTAQTDCSAEVMKFCVKLDDRWSEFMLASQSVQEASQTIEGLNDRMRTFLGDTLAHRAHGHPRVMLDAKEARDYLLYTSLNLEHVQSMMQKETLDSAILTRLEEILRKHFRLLRDVFRHYAGLAGGVSLEGLMKLYQDCKLRTRSLAPHHLEVIFCDHMDTAVGDRLLSPSQFTVVLIQCANLKFKDKFSQIPDQFAEFIEHTVKTHACQEDARNIFQRMAYDPKVRKVLDRHAKELKMIFLLYAMMDNSTTDAIQNVHTMNFQEFHMLLSHCNLLDETLTQGAVQQIFEGIQQSAQDEGGDAGVGRDGEDDAGIDDDEELSFSEFLDGLAAVAAYKHPDPFTPFDQRVNAFIMKFFATVRHHWSRKRTSAQVEALLNALQKKLR